MVRSALQNAADYKAMERDALEMLSPCGACFPVEAVADILSCLNNRRLWAVSLLICAEKEAKTEQERREIASALALVNSSERAF